MPDEPVQPCVNKDYLLTYLLTYNYGHLKGDVFILFIVLSFSKVAT